MTEVENCMHYFSEEDNCEYCDPGYYISDNFECFDAVPGGVQNCCLYST